MKNGKPGHDVVKALKRLYVNILLLSISIVKTTSVIRMCESCVCMCVGKW